MKNKKLWLIVGAIAIVAAIAFVFSPRRAPVPADDKPIIKIGVSLPLSGDVAILGKSIKGALEIALAEIPANSKYKYEFVFSDDNYELKKIAINQNRHISVDKSDALISVFDGTAVTAPIAEKHHIPHIGCTWGSKFFAQYPYSINHWSRTDTQARAFIKMLKDEEISSIAIVSVNFSSNEELVGHVADMAKQSGITVTSANFINKGTKDFRAIIEQIRRQKPAAVMFLLLDPEIGVFSKQITETKLNIPIVAIDNLHSAQYPELLNGAKFVYSSIGEDKFVAKLSKHNLITVPCVANLYDGFKILVNIYESADHKLTGEEIKDHLYKIKDYPSALGVKISVDKDGIIDSPLIRARIVESKMIKE